MKFVNDHKSDVLTLRRVVSMSEAEARNFICSVRWMENGGNPICPSCGGITVYVLKNGDKFKCRQCYHQYSVTSGSCLASTKAPLSVWLSRIYVFACAAKGVSSLQMARTIGEQQRSSYHGLMLMREAMQQAIGQIRLNGEVEIDGATFGGHRAHSNMASEFHGRRRRFDKKMTANRCVIVVARQRGGRTVPFVVDKESSALDGIKRVVSRDAIIHADMAHGWDALLKLYKMMRINHSWAFATADCNTNSAESFFARMRKLHNGTHHKIGIDNMLAYACENAWRIDHAGISNTERTIEMLKLMLDYKKMRVVKKKAGHHDANVIVHDVIAPDVVAAELAEKAA